MTSLFLALSAALAAEPLAAEPPAIEAPVAPAPAPPPASRPLEVREFWSPDGRLVRRLVVESGALVREETFTWAPDGAPSERRATEGASQLVETWTTAGDTTTRVLVRDGVEVEREESAHADGRLVRRAFTVGGVTTHTTWTYDAHGQLLTTEERGQDGTLRARLVADRAAPPPPKVPFTVRLDGGVATNSDVSTTSITAGFAVGRAPPAELYATDPLELSAYGSYTRASSAGTRTNDELKAGFGLDYNELVGRLTAFLFTTVQRNPVANLDVDLVVAPVGLKYEIVARGPFRFDVSFAPVWNFRSIAVASGGACDGVVLDQDGHCAFSKVRGSLRVRVGYTRGVVTVKDTIELLPTLNPTDGDLVAAIEAEAIFRNTATLSFQVTDHLSVSESVLFVRDPLLAEQADCSADPTLPLCAGTSLQTGTLVSASYAF